MSRPSAVLSIAAVFAILVSGCSATRDLGLLKAGAVNAKRAPAGAVMKALDARREKMKTMVARMNVVVTDEAKDKEIGLTGAYLGDHKGNYRLRIKQETRIVLDVAFHDGDVDLWLPGKNRFYRGKRDQIEAGSSPELRVLNRIGNAPDLFFPVCWAPKADERYVEKDRGSEYVIVNRREGKMLKPVRRFTLNDLLPVCSYQELFSSDVKLLGTVTYSQYLFPGPFAGEETDRPRGVPYPAQVTIGVPDSKIKLSLEIEELLLNTPIHISRLYIAAPEDIKVRDLSEALTENGSLFRR